MGSTSVSIPTDSAAPISIQEGSNPAVNFLLPKELSLQPGKTSSNGTVVCRGTDGKADAAVQTLQSGSVRVQTILRDVFTPREYSYSLGEGYKPVRAEHGSMWALGFDATGKYGTYAIKEAWAQDAHGKSVPTRYEIRGNDLVQVVSPTADTVYPIVADPTWEWYAFAYGTGFNKAETRALANAGALASFCGLLGPAGIACGVAAGSWFFQAQRMANMNSCVFIAAVPIPVAIEYISANCY